MKKLLILVVLLVPVLAQAQVSSSTARRVRGGNTPPATCKATAPADVFIDTNATAASRFLVCTSANTWTAQEGPAGTTINATDNVIPKRLSASAFTNSALSDSGTIVASTLPLRIPAGAVGAPSFHFSTATTTGLYEANGLIRFAISGVQVFAMNQAEIFTFQKLSFSPDNTVDIGTSGITRPRTGYFGTSVVSTAYNTTTNCADSAGAAACGAAVAGSFVMDAAATTVVVSSTSITANSQIFIQEDSSLGTRLSVTCNTTTGRDFTVTARTAGTSFTVTSSAAPVTNPACLSFFVVN